MLYICFILERARVIADTVGGQALTLSELDNFHPEDGMILANTTSIGMQPKVDETPISKVMPYFRLSFVNQIEGLYSYFLLQSC